MQPTRNAALTRLHPQSSTTQRLLASAGTSARDKGLVFDAQQGRWIRTLQRSHGSGGIAGRTQDSEPGANIEEEDPFRDFSKLRSGDCSTAAVSKGAILPAKEASALALSGLGITEGTPPLPAVKPVTSATRGEEHEQRSPRGRFEQPAMETRPVDGQPEELLPQLESEDSATWSRNDVEHKQQAAPAEPGSRSSPSGSRLAPDLSVDDSVVVESNMLNLYRRAHEAQDDADDVGSTVISPAGSSDEAARRSSATASNKRTAVQPPRSALKNPRAQSEPVRSTATPLASRVLAATGPPRSVSFPDGKTSGKIEGLGGGGASRLTKRQAVPPEFVIGPNGGPGSLQFDGLETQSESENGGDSEADRTVTQVDASVASAVRVHGESRGPLPKSHAVLTVKVARPDPAMSRRAQHSVSYTSSTTSSPSLSLTGSRNGGTRTFVRTRSQNGNATFLTECSFGVSHDRLLQYITDVEPFEPDWEGLRSIDLSGKKAEGVVRLKEFLPNLDEVNLYVPCPISHDLGQSTCSAVHLPFRNDNEIAYLTGIPPTLRTLLAASNRLTDLTSFQHLSNLERLDISDNQLESVRHLACLRHLRELKADGNRISSLDGLADLDSLVRVSLKSNCLTDLDLGETKWCVLLRTRLGLRKGC